MDFKKLQQRAENFRNMLDRNHLEEKRMVEKEKERKKGITKGLFLGTIIGGLAGIFFAPDTGANTRTKTKEELEKIKESLEVGIEEGKEKIAVIYEDKKEKMTEIFEDKKEDIENKLISIKKKVNKINCSIDEACATNEEEEEK